jgi:hypothetical protein
MKAELVFNLGEVGMSEWEDGKDKKVIILKTMDGQTIQYRASRNVKYLSIVMCITARLTPCKRPTGSVNCRLRRVLTHREKSGRLNLQWMMITEFIRDHNSSSAKTACTWCIVSGHVMLEQGKVEVVRTPRSFFFNSLSPGSLSRDLIWPIPR